MLSPRKKKELKINQRRISINSIEIGIPAPEQVLILTERHTYNGRKVGRVKNSKTLNYKSFTPHVDGLFCERIFGPVESEICACGKKGPLLNSNGVLLSICPNCEVEYTDQRVRRYRLGHIGLISPVTHIWHLNGRPSYLSLFLGKRKKTLARLAYCNDYIVEQSFSKVDGNNVLNCGKQDSASADFFSAKQDSASADFFKSRILKGFFKKDRDSKVIYKKSKVIKGFTPSRSQEKNKISSLKANFTDVPLSKSDQLWARRALISTNKSPAFREPVNLFGGVYNPKNRYNQEGWYTEEGWGKKLPDIQLSFEEREIRDLVSFLKSLRMYAGTKFRLPPKEVQSSSIRIDSAENKERISKPLTFIKKNTFSSTYTRSQTLPCLPTLTCNFDLRDGFLSFFDISPPSEDIPIPVYCKIPRRYPLRDVHKFMADQAFSREMSSSNKNVSSVDEPWNEIYLTEEQGGFRRCTQAESNKSLYVTRDLRKTNPEPTPGSLHFIGGSIKLGSKQKSELFSVADQNMVLPNSRKPIPMKRAATSSTRKTFDKTETKEVVSKASLSYGVQDLLGLGLYKSREATFINHSGLSLKRLPEERVTLFNVNHVNTLNLLDAINEKKVSFRGALVSIIFDRIVTTLMGCNPISKSNLKVPKPAITKPKASLEKFTVAPLNINRNTFKKVWLGAPRTVVMARRIERQVSDTDQSGDISNLQDLLKLKSKSSRFVNLSEARVRFLRDLFLQIKTPNKTENFVVSNQVTKDVFNREKVNPISELLSTKVDNTPLFLREVEFRELDLRVSPLFKVKQASLLGVKTLRVIPLNDARKSYSPQLSQDGFAIILAKDKYPDVNGNRVIKRPEQSSGYPQKGFSDSYSKIRIVSINSLSLGLGSTERRTQTKVLLLRNTLNLLSRSRSEHFYLPITPQSQIRLPFELGFVKLRPDLDLLRHKMYRDSIAAQLIEKDTIPEETSSRIASKDSSIENSLSRSISALADPGEKIEEWLEYWFEIWLQKSSKVVLKNQVLRSAIQNPRFDKNKINLSQLLQQLLIYKSEPFNHLSCFNRFKGVKSPGLSAHIWSFLQKAVRSQDRILQLVPGARFNSAQLSKGGSKTLPLTDSWLVNRTNDGCGELAFPKVQLADRLVNRLSKLTEDIKRSKYRTIIAPHVSSDGEGVTFNSSEDQDLSCFDLALPSQPSRTLTRASLESAQLELELLSLKDWTCQNQAKVLQPHRFGVSSRKLPLKGVIAKDQPMTTNSNCTEGETRASQVKLAREFSSVPARRPEILSLSVLGSTFEAVLNYAEQARAKPSLELALRSYILRLKNQTEYTESFVSTDPIHRLGDLIKGEIRGLPSIQIRSMYSLPLLVLRGEAGSEGFSVLPRDSNTLKVLSNQLDPNLNRSTLTKSREEQVRKPRGSSSDTFNDTSWDFSLHKIFSKRITTNYISKGEEVKERTRCNSNSNSSEARINQRLVRKSVGPKHKIASYLVRSEQREEWVKRELFSSDIRGLTSPNSALLLPSVRLDSPCKSPLLFDNQFLRKKEKSSREENLTILDNAYRRPKGISESVPNIKSQLWFPEVVIYFQITEKVAFAQAIAVSDIRDRQLKRTFIVKGFLKPNKNKLSDGKSGQLLYKLSKAQSGHIVYQFRISDYSTEQIKKYWCQPERVLAKAGFSKDSLAKIESQKYSSLANRYNQNASLRSIYASWSSNLKRYSISLNKMEKSSVPARTSAPFDPLDPYLESKANIQAIKEVLSYTSGGALRDLLRCFNIKAFSAILLNKVKLLREYHKGYFIYENDIDRLPLGDMYNPEKKEAVSPKAEARFADTEARIFDFTRGSRVRRPWRLDHEDFGFTKTQDLIYRSQAKVYPKVMALTSDQPRLVKSEVGAKSLQDSSPLLLSTTIDKQTANKSQALFLKLKIEALSKNKSKSFVLSMPTSRNAKRFQHLQTQNTRSRNYRKSLSYNTAYNTPYEELPQEINRFSRSIHRTARRLKIVQLLMRNNRRPEWMLISTLPVLPPDLRPILQMSENLIVASDLNTLYQRVIYRNNRQYKLRIVEWSYATQLQRLVQDGVDRLIENGKGGSKPFLTPGGRPLKSLSDTLKGKKGRFRLNLLGKRVDFSGRSVIVVSPHLKIHECGLPREMALELYQYILIRQMLLKKQVSSVIIAKKVIRQQKPFVWDTLRELIYHHPILLNRAPTLHRLGIQAFQPKLVLGSTILLHPLVCAGFNADFDGDQMGVHLPLCDEARAESWDLLWSRNNLLSPATGEPILLPSQDMVLGFYHMTALLPPQQANSSFANIALTTTRPWPAAPLPIQKSRSDFYKAVGEPILVQKGLRQSHFFSSLDVLRAYQSGDLDIHTPIWLQWNGKIENNDSDQTPLQLRINSFGVTTQLYPSYKYRKDVTPKSTTIFNLFIRTTSGRIIVNNIFP